MGTIDVSLLHSRFRLPRGAAAHEWLARIDAIQSDLVETHLEPALASFAMTDEVICVRRIALPLRLSGAVSDWQLSLQWSALIADELQRILTRNASDEVVRFTHELAARKAFLIDALGGRSERDWLWQQLGWLPARTVTSSHERLDAAIAAGIAAADGVIPLLRSLAGAGLLPPLARAVDKRKRDRLLIAALTTVPDAAAQSFVRWLTDEASSDEILLERPTTVATTFSAPFLALLRETVNVDERRGWAVLAILCCEPHRLRVQPEAAAVLAEAWVRQAAAPPSAFLRPIPGASAETSQPFKVAPQPDDPSRELAPPGGAATPWGPPLRRPDSAFKRPAPSADRKQPEEILFVSRRPVEGETAFGGLLFLLPLVAEIGALDKILTEPALARWPLTAVLHRLALTLLPPLGVSDPAALAFAGLPPDAAPPDAVQPGDWRRDLDHSADAALGAAAARLVDELSVRLPQWVGPALVQRVAERWAVIAVDPGWIEVRLRLADVSVELRRAALDLDPGFLPWLGIVLRYRYA